jgi:hypothetical protein
MVAISHVGREHLGLYNNNNGIEEHGDFDHVGGLDEGAHLGRSFISDDRVAPSRQLDNQYNIYTIRPNNMRVLASDMVDEFALCEDWTGGFLDHSHISYEIDDLDTNQFDNLDSIPLWKVGSYNITFWCTGKCNTTESNRVYRKVEVQDEHCQRCSLVGDSTEYIEASFPFEDEGATCYDWLTGKVPDTNVKTDYATSDPSIIPAALTDVNVERTGTYTIDYTVHVPPGSAYVPSTTSAQVNMCTDSCDTRHVIVMDTLMPVIGMPMVRTITNAGQSNDVTKFHYTPALDKGGFQYPDGSTLHTTYKTRDANTNEVTKHNVDANPASEAGENGEHSDHTNFQNVNGVSGGISKDNGGIPSGVVGDNGNTADNEVTFQKDLRLKIKDWDNSQIKTNNGWSSHSYFHNSHAGTVDSYDQNSGPNEYVYPHRTNGPGKRNDYGGKSAHNTPIRTWIDTMAEKTATGHSYSMFAWTAGSLGLCVLLALAYMNIKKSPDFIDV